MKNAAFANFAAIAWPLFSDWRYNSRPGPRVSTRAVRDVKRTFGVGIALIVLLAVVTLSHAPPRVVRTNAPTGVNAQIATLIESGELCQAHETLPAGATAVRLSVGAYVAAPIKVTLSSGSRILTQGRRRADWTGSPVTVPIAPLRTTASDVTLCVDIAPNNELIYIQGASAPAGEAATLGAGQSLGGKLVAEYLAPGSGSWWSRIGSVASHMALGRAFTGTWVVWLTVILMVAVGGLAMGLAVKELSSRGPSRRRFGALGRIPRGAWICALIALLNACAWSLIVPPFQGKDEADHFTYVETLAENLTLPDNGQQNGVYSAQETQVLQAGRYYQMTHNPAGHAIFTQAEQSTLETTNNAHLSLRTSGEAGIATSEPPLYYALQTVPYELARGNILVELQLMRLVGALFGALTALLIFLFLRELMPGTPWAATVGALCTALQPMFAAMSATVSPDAMLFPVSAAVFLCIARAFRRGFTLRLALVFGAVIAIGFVTKLNFVAIGLGAFVGLAALAVRERRSKRWRALLSPVIAACIGGAPVAIYALRNILTSRPTFGSLSGETGLVATSSLFDEISYTWQFFFPRIPGMTRYFAGITTYKDIWFDRSVGLYGWMDTVFPTWVDNVALIPATLVALLCGRGLIAGRGAWKPRLLEFGVYVALTLWIIVMLGVSSYHGDALTHGPAFGEPRYLLPLLSLLGAVVAVAVRGAGRRWMAVVGATLVVLFLAHDLFSQLQTVARYYS